MAILEALADRDSASVLTRLDQGAAEGVQPSDLLAGVLEFLRDAMVLAVGAEPVLLAVSPRQKPRLQAIVDRWSIDAIVAALQILAEARARMRGVAHARLLAELALVRVARLENLSDLGDLIQRLSALESGGPVPHKNPAQGTKKKLSPSDPVHTLVSSATEPARVESRPSAPLDSRGQAAVPARFREGEPEPSQTEGAARPVAANPADAAKSVSAEPAAVSSVEPAAASRAQAGAVETSLVEPAATSLVEPVETSLVEPAATSHVEPGRRGAEPVLELEAVRQLWPDLVKKVGSTLGMKLVAAEAIEVESPDVLVIAAKPGYNSLADSCGTDEAKERISHCLQRLLRRPVTVRYQRVVESMSPAPSAPAGEQRPTEILAVDPMVQKVVELFEARPLHLEYEDDSEPT